MISEAVLLQNNLLRLYWNSLLSKPWYQIVDRSSRISRAENPGRAQQREKSTHRRMQLGYVGVNTVLQRMRKLSGRFVDVGQGRSLSREKLQRTVWQLGSS